MYTRTLEVNHRYEFHEGTKEVDGSTLHDRVGPHLIKGSDEGTYLLSIMLTMMNMGMHKPTDSKNWVVIQENETTQTVVNTNGWTVNLSSGHPRFSVVKANGMLSTDPIESVMSKEVAYICAAETYNKRNTWVDSYPMWEEMTEEPPQSLLDVLEREFSVLHTSVEVTYLRRRYLMYTSDGRLTTQVQCIGTWHGAPLLYDGWAWGIRFLLDGRDHLTQGNIVFLDDNGLFICTDWCQRDRSKSLDDGINLYSGSHVKSLSTWITVDLADRAMRERGEDVMGYQKITHASYAERRPPLTHPVNMLVPKTDGFTYSPKPEEKGGSFFPKYEPPMWEHTEPDTAKLDYMVFAEKVAKKMALHADSLKGHSMAYLQEMDKAYPDLPKTVDYAYITTSPSSASVNVPLYYAGKTDEPAKPVFGEITDEEVAAMPPIKDDTWEEEMDEYL